MMATSHISAAQCLCCSYCIHFTIASWEVFTHQGTSANSHWRSPPTLWYHCLSLTSSYVVHTMFGGILLCVSPESLRGGFRAGWWSAIMKCFVLPVTTRFSSAVGTWTNHVTSLSLYHTCFNEWITIMKCLTTQGLKLHACVYMCGACVMHACE